MRAGVHACVRACVCVCVRERERERERDRQTDRQTESKRAVKMPKNVLKIPRYGTVKLYNARWSDKINDDASFGESRKPRRSERVAYVHHTSPCV